LEKKNAPWNKLINISENYWALLAFVIVLATFLGNNYFSQKLASTTGSKVSPWFTGGEVIRTIQHDQYNTLVHRPVFDSLIWEKKSGFVQVNWEPLERLPDIIEERIDYNDDGREDFLIKLDTQRGRADIIPLSPSVESFEGAYKLKNGWAIRVLLKKS